MTPERLLDILKAEMARANGCTEVAAAALAAARAARVLDAPLERLVLTVSPAVFKNGVHAAVPGADAQGLETAAALGAVIAAPEMGLDILRAADAGRLREAEELLAAGAVEVRAWTKAPHAVYLCAEAEGLGERARAVIAGGHAHFAEVSRGRRVLLWDARDPEEADPAAALREVPMRRLLEMVEEIPAAKLGFLLEAARMNAAAAEAGLADPSARLGRALQGRSASPSARVGALAGAATEARMRGLNVPVMAISGSGNHGIAAFLSVYALARERGADEARTARALALASAVTVCIKAHTGKLTSFCGCAVAPATGLAAAAADLMGGGVDDMLRAMQSVMGTFAGMLCDGAKLSCAFKIAAVTSSAVELAALALAGAWTPEGEGVVGRTVEETIGNLARLNDPGMSGTDRVVLDIEKERRVPSRPQPAFVSSF